MKLAAELNHVVYLDKDALIILSRQIFEVAKMLREHKTYLEIADKTGASTATISRVNRSLNYGNDGYDMVFERINQKEDS